MLLYERVLAPKFARSAVRVPEVVDEKNAVIVAGYGRFGQVVTRVLNGLKIEATVIDHDPNQVDTVRRYGSNAYYGDATRIDVLERAGVERARLLVVAIDDDDAAMRLARLARSRWPQLRLIVRARSRTDAYEYFEMGVTSVRETFGSALEAAELALRALGYGPVGARRVDTDERNDHVRVLGRGVEDLFVRDRRNPAARLPVDGEENGREATLAVVRGDVVDRRQGLIALEVAPRRSTQLRRHRIVAVSGQLRVDVDVDRSDGYGVDHGETVPSRSWSAAPQASRSHSVPGAPISETLVGRPLRRPTPDGSATTGKPVQSQ